MKNIFAPLLILGCLFLFASCRSSKVDNNREVRDVFLSDSSTVLDLTAEAVPLDLLCPTGILVIDTFLLVLQHAEDTYIKVYSLDNYHFLGDFLRRGGGPNEVNVFGGFTQWFVEEGEAKALIQSYPQYVAVLNINQSLQKKEAVFEKVYSFTGDANKTIFAESNAAFLIKDGLFLLTKDPVRSQRKEDYNMYFELYDYDANLVLNSFYAMNIPYLSLNIPAFYQGTMTLKPDKKKIAVFCRFLNMYTITDLTQAKASQYFPDGKSFDLEKIKSAPGHYYWAVCSTDQKLIALSKKGVRPEDLQKDQSSSEIHFLDWDGRILYRLMIKDNIKCISIDEVNGLLYAVLMNDSIVKYNVQSFLDS